MYSYEYALPMTAILCMITAGESKKREVHSGMNL